jgi:hypothetical protein
MDTLLMIAPIRRYDDRLSWYPSVSLRAVDGRVVRPSGWFMGFGARKDALIIGPTGVSHWWPPDATFTVRYEDCVAVRHLPGHGRELWGGDGHRVVIHPDGWKGGKKVIAEIDARIPRELVACDKHGIGALPGS